MNIRFQSLSVLCLALTVLLILPVMAQDAVQTPLPFAVQGPYGIGTRLIVLDKGTENALVINAFYPIVVPESSPEDPRDDALVDPSGAPYPVVIFSHGWGSTPRLYSFQINHLASWGFVVLAVNHVDTKYRKDPYVGLIMRLIQVRRLVDKLEVLNGTDGAFEGLLDSQKVAVTGHSAGGITSIGAGGAGLHWDSVEAYCVVYAARDPGCNQLDAQKATIQALLGDADAESWQAIWDDRVKAILPMSGPMDLFGQEGLAQITVPTLILYGSADDVVPVDWMSPVYGAVTSSQKIEAVFEDAHHILFTDFEDHPWKLQEGHDLINHLTTAFLLDVLKGDAQAQAALAQDALQFAGIAFQTQGY